MRPPAYSVLIGLASVLTTLPGCSQSSSTSSGAQGCAVQYAGNVGASADLASCATLGFSPDAGANGDFVLNFQLASETIQALQVSIDLGASPATGTYSSETSTHWSADGLNAANCAYSAGNQAAPPGSFTLTLTSVDSSSGARGAHGNLVLTTYVLAPPATDCGIGNIEDISVAF
jgi:hypothetical protein